MSTTLRAIEPSWEAYIMAQVRDRRGEHAGAAGDLGYAHALERDHGDLRALLAWIVAHCETPLADDPERLAAAVELLTRTAGV